MYREHYQPRAADERRFWIVLGDEYFLSIKSTGLETAAEEIKWTSDQEKAPTFTLAELIKFHYKVVIGFTRTRLLEKAT